MSKQKEKKITNRQVYQLLSDVMIVVKEIRDTQPLDIKNFILPNTLRCNNAPYCNDSGRYGRDRKVVRKEDGIYLIANCEICHEPLSYKLT